MKIKNKNKIKNVKNLIESVDPLAFVILEPICIGEIKSITGLLAEPWTNKNKK